MLFKSDVDLGINLWKYSKSVRNSMFLYFQLLKRILKFTLREFW